MDQQMLSEHPPPRVQSASRRIARRATNVRRMDDVVSFPKVSGATPETTRETRGLPYFSRWAFSVRCSMFDVQSFSRSFDLRSFAGEANAKTARPSTESCIFSNASCPCDAAAAGHQRAGVCPGASRARRAVRPRTRAGLAGNRAQSPGEVPS